MTKHKTVLTDEGIELRVISRVERFPVDVVTHLAEFHDERTLTACTMLSRRNPFYHPVENKENIWRTLVLKDITDNPKLEEKETHQQYYRRAYSLFIRIKKALVARESKQNDFNKLFAEIVENGYEKYAQHIIEKVDINAKVELENNEANRTPLHRAAINGHAKIVKLLLDKGAKIDPCGDGCYSAGDALVTVEGTGHTPLTLAACHGRTDCLELLIKAYSANRAVTTINYATIAWGNNALHEAADGGHAGCVKLLLDAGAVVDLTNKDNQSPLDLARSCSGKGHKECARLLEERMRALNMPVPREEKSCVIF